MVIFAYLMYAKPLRCQMNKYIFFILRIVELIFDSRLFFVLFLALNLLAEWPDVVAPLWQEEIHPHPFLRQGSIQVKRFLILPKLKKVG